MHELSIALGIVRIVEETARKASAKAVTLVALRVGTLSGVELDALRFAWPMATQDTIAEGATLDIEVIPGRARCLECHAEYAMEQLFDNCPQCHSPFKQILQGKELAVKAVEVE